MARRQLILTSGAALVLILAACGEADRGSQSSVPTSSTRPAADTQPATDHASPLEEQRTRWPEQVAQLEELMESDFLLEHGGSAAIFDGVLHIELFSEADAAAARLRWPDAVITMLGPVEY